MTLAISKTQVERNFSRAAASYDLWATPQKAIARQLIDLIPDAEKVTEVLDVGCGTGNLTALARARYPRASLCAMDIAPGMIEFCRRRWPDGRLAEFVVGDAEGFDLGRRFDLIVSSCAFQWFADRARAMRNIRRHVRVGGRVALASPVAGTLAELAESYRDVMGRAMPGLNLWDGVAYEELMEAAEAPVGLTWTATMRFRYRTPWEAFQALRGIGATLKGHPDFRPLAVPKIKEIALAYQRRFAQTDGGIPVTYCVWFAVSRKVNGDVGIKRH